MSSAKYDLMCGDKADEYANFIKQNSYMLDPEDREQALIEMFSYGLKAVFDSASSLIKRQTLEAVIHAALLDTYETEAGEEVVRDGVDCVTELKGEVIALKHKVGVIEYVHELSYAQIKNLEQVVAQAYAKLHEDVKNLQEQYQFMKAGQ